MPHLRPVSPLRFALLAGFACVTLASGQPVLAPAQERPASPVVPGQPAIRDAIPGLGGEDVLVPKARLVREGAFIIQRSGVLVKAPTGEWIVAFAPDDPSKPNSPRLPPMVLVPNRALTTIEATIGNQAEGIVITVTGEVLVYHNRNYLLLSLYRLASVDQPAPPPADSNETPGSEPGSEPSSEPAANPAAPSRPSAADDPRVLELMESLERTRTPGILPPAATDAPGETTVLAAGSSGNDGEPIVRRRGRLVRGGAGHWYFTPDSDTGDAAATSPRPLLPCQTLMELERLAERRGDGLVVELTGRTYLHQGQIMILPTMFMIAAPSDLAPLQ